MSTEWSRLHEPHERLKWARIHAGFETGKAAAKSLGMNPDTYTAYEREPGKSKSTNLDHQSAIRFAKKFKVSWTWLLIAEGTPFHTTLSDAQKRAVSIMADADEADQERAVAAIAAFLKSA